MVWTPITEATRKLGFDCESFFADDEPQLSETPQLDRIRKQLDRLEPGGIG